MGNDGAGEDSHPHHAVQIWEVKPDRLAAMHEKISATPKMLSKWAGHPSCSIFRVPQSLIDINGRSYHPHIVSIGPYHHGQPHLQMIQEHKWRFLAALLRRTQGRGLELEDYLKAIYPLEPKVRECYSEIIHLTADEFTELLVLDGCFIIELFRKYGKVVPVEPGDPLTSMSWVYSFFLRDLIRIENQIPYFILQELFDLTRMPGEESGPSLSDLALGFFNNTLQRPDEVIEKYRHLDARHLLDFLRSSFIPLNQPEPSKSGSTRVIQCISKLRRAGIKLRPNKAESFLTVRFRRGMIEMPTVSIDDFSSCFMINCVAYEQCRKNCSTHFTTYATLMDCLINTARDVEYLSDCSIIENYFGTEAEVAHFINNLGKDVTFDIDKCYLARLFDEVNEYYKNGWHVQWAGFRYRYFRSPWSFISALAAFVLLVLSVLQTYYTMIG
ncbi:hypothetical protein NMG60_11008392 [Bertholletia excelsa]